jgi:hypothetical protein
MGRGGKIPKKKLKRGRRKERDTQHNCRMSGGAAKRAKSPELTLRQEALLNAMLGSDENALSIAMYGDVKDFHKIPNIMKMVDDAKSVVAPPLAQVGEKRSYEPDYLKDEISRETNLIKATHTANMASDKVLMDNLTRHLAGDTTMITQLFCNQDSLSPLHEACRVTIQRVEPKDTFAKGHLKLHKKVLREELLLRAGAIREDHVRREQYIQKQMDELKVEKQFFEENICERK